MDYIINNNQIGKEADNVFKENSLKKTDNKEKEINHEIQQFYDKINDSKRQLEKIEKINEDIYILNKKINKTIDYLNDSVKGTNINHKLDDIYYQNQTTLNRTKLITEEHSEKINDNISKLYTKVEEVEHSKKELSKEND